MGSFGHLLKAEFIKLRRSSALKVFLLFPIFFLLLEFAVFERPLIFFQSIPDSFRETFNSLQTKIVGSIWAGFFHSVLLAVLPAILFRVEHKNKMWGRLHAMPVAKGGIFLAKATVALLLCLGSLVFIWCGLWIERIGLAMVNPALAVPFRGVELAKVLGWLWLGSLPLLAFYLWVADRINSLAVPVVFGLIGFLLVISLSREDVPQAWKRDLNPWVLPYVCAQRGIESPAGRQDTHAAAAGFREEPNVIRLPNGKKIKTWQNIPDDVMFPPPPPTPSRILVAFSILAGGILIGVGAINASRQRY